MKYDVLANNLVKYRNKKKLSVDEVARILKVKPIKVEQWEKGIKNPSIVYIKKLSELYNIPVNNIVNEKQLVDELIQKRRLDIIEFIIISILIFLLIFTASYITNRRLFNNGKDLIYEFKGKGNIFSFDDGILVLNDKTRYIELSDFKLNKDVNLKRLVVNIAFNEKIWKVSEINNCTNEECINWLNNLSYKEYTYNRLPLHKKEKDDSFVEYKDKFPNDFKVEINYCTDKECSVEILDVQSKKINIKEN